MKYRQLGKSGVRVSAIGLGTNQFGGPIDQQGVNQVVDVALELGINFIDTADEYQGGRSEEALGVALKGHWQQVVLATKVEHPAGPGPNDYGASRYHIVNGVEASLRRLQSDHIDVLMVHSWDDTTPIEETLQALSDLIRDGKLRYIAASNFAAWQMAEANVMAAMRGWSPFIALESHYNMLHQEPKQEIVPYCSAHGVGIVPYFPLAGGFLTGKYRRGQQAAPAAFAVHNAYVQQYMNAATYEKIERLIAWAGERSHALADLAHAWLLAQPEVSSVISGAAQRSQVEANARAAEWQLSLAEREEVDAILAAEYDPAAPVPS
jgi:aryl-alcohol dehydrogenase-like predicted oxidoreductase